MRRALLCVVTGDYLPMALTMASSYAAFHPVDDIRILLVDVSALTASQIQINSLPKVRIDGIDSIQTAPHTKMRTYYDASEMVGALRSSYIKKILFEEGYDQIVMLDADILCYAPLSPFFDALGRKLIVLAPHVNSPIPDKNEPDDHELLVAGMVNNGCCAMSATSVTHVALDWLEEKARHNCFVIPELNLYNEQTWVSFLPWYFPEAVELVRDPGLNVAYWNLYERPLQQTDKGITANGMPLRFFHYSGYRPGLHPQLSGHANMIASDGVLRAMLDDYRQRLADGVKKYPRIKREFHCTAEPVATRLRNYAAAWGKPPDLYRRYRRAQWLGLSRLKSRLRSLIRG
jgi:hypothetical protein